MSRTRKIILWVFAAAFGIVLLGVISLVTTVTPSGRSLPPGMWIVTVQDTQGKPIPDASAELVWSDSGLPILAVGEPQDNGAVRSDSNGRIVVTLTQPLPTHSTQQRLFWIWTLENRDEPGAKIVAPGYESVDAPIEPGRRVTVMLRGNQ